MNKTSLVIIDNGQIYSSHRHWVACSCSNRAEAEKLVKSLKEWFAKATLAYDKDELHKFMVENHPPVWGATSEEFDPDFWNPTDFIATVIEVPQWAEGLP